MSGSRLKGLYYIKSSHLVDFEVIYSLDAGSHLDIILEADDVILSLS